MDDEWWKKARAEIPGCGKFKKKGLENEDELAKCFSDITTIGIDHWSPHVVNVEAPENVDETQDEEINCEPQDDEFIPDTQEEDIGITPPPASGKRLARSIDRSDVLNCGKLAQSYHDSYMDKAPPRFVFSQQSGMGWLMETVNTPGECHRMLRMNEVIFQDLHDVLVERYGLKLSKHMNTYEMLAIFLFTCGGCESNRRVQNKFKHSGETISRKFHEVLDCVVAMAKDFLRPTDPNFRNVHKRIRNDKRAYPHFKDCIGALDGTHIRVYLSPEEQVRYIGKTGIATQNVLAVCDFDMRFTYVAAGQLGSLHDTSVLYHALEANVNVFPHPPQGKYYVVDAGYPNCPGYLAPYKGERYHLPEWHRGMEPNTPKEKFNRIHSSVRNVIERSFGVLKMKWQILYKMPDYSMVTQKKIVAATMVLHNFIREYSSVDVDFANFDRDPTYMATVPKRYNKYAVSQHASDGSTSESSFVTMDTFRDSMATSIALAWN
ncbi:uncharacterized protein [Setaria viridis]|uniref:uncharacterized protein n=1 Tax=Setaria viridis TaxID=4556 RepID=UPI003B3B1E60